MAKHPDIEIDQRELRGAMAANDKLAPDTDRHLEANTATVARDVSGAQRTAAAQTGRQARLMHPKAGGPGDGFQSSVEAGGEEPVGSRHTPSGNLVYGSEYGSTGKFRQFGRFRKGGRWFNKAEQDRSDQTARTMDNSVDQSIRAWGER